MIILAKSQVVDTKIDDLESVRDSLPDTLSDARKLINAAIEILRSVGSHQRVEDEFIEITGLQPKVVFTLDTFVNEYGNGKFADELVRQKKIDSVIRETQTGLSSSKKKWDTVVDEVIDLTDEIIEEGSEGLSKSRVRSLIRTQLDTMYSNFSKAQESRTDALDEAEAIPLIKKTKRSQERVVSELIKDSSADKVIPLMFPDEDDAAAAAQLEKMNRAYHDRQKKQKTSPKKDSPTDIVKDDLKGKEPDPRKFSEIAGQIDAFFSKGNNSILNIAGNWVLPYIPNENSIEAPLMSILSDVDSSLNRVISAANRYKRNVMYSSAIYLVPALVKSFNKAIVTGLDNNDYVIGSTDRIALDLGGLLTKSKNMIDKLMGRRKINPDRIDNRSLTNMTGWVDSNRSQISDVVKMIPEDNRLYKDLSKFSSALDKASRKSASLAKKYQKKQPNVYYAIQSMSVFWKGMADSLMKGLS